MRYLTRVIATAAFALCILTSSIVVTQPAEAAPSPGSIEGTLITVAPGASKIVVDFTSPLNTLSLSVTDATARQAILATKPGDTIKVDVDNTTVPANITKIDQISRPIPLPIRLATTFGVAIFLIFLAAAATNWRPWAFMIGVDNRYSNSQSQLAIWFGAVAAIYISAVVLRIAYLGWNYIGGVALPEHLIELTGLSAFTFGGAKVITVAKINNAAATGAPVAKYPAARPNLLRDLISNDKGQADLGDFQMILITLAAVIVFAMSAINFFGVLPVEQTITLPDVDTSLLSGFGIGQGAYLIKKAATNLGDG